MQFLSMARQLQRLGPRHHAAIQMRLAGDSPAGIAESLGVRRQTVYLWFCDPLVKQAVEDGIARTDRIVAQELAINALHALALLRDIASREPADVAEARLQLDAVREMLDRHASTAVKDHEALARMIRDDIRAMDDDTLIATLNHLAGKDA